jgi:hypothetical protein
MIFSWKRNLLLKHHKEMKLANPSEHNSIKWSGECELETSSFACLEDVLETSWWKCTMLGLLCCQWQYTSRWQGISSDALHDLYNEYVPLIAKTNLRKGVISYLKTNRITIFIKYVDVEHTLNVKKFEEEVNKPMRNGLEKQLTKKRLNCLLMKSLRFFLLKILLRRMMCNKNNFYKTWVFASCLKLSSYAFCGKFLIQVIYFTFLFLTCHPI